MKEETSVKSGHTFKKSERLSRKKLIDELFEKGSSFYLYPFRVIYLEKEISDGPVQVLISVSSRNFKRAVDRNKIKRLIREAYRQNKSILYNELRKNEKQILLALLYSSKSIDPFDSVRSRLIEVLKLLAEKNEKHPE